MDRWACFRERGWTGGSALKEGREWTFRSALKEGSGPICLF